MHRFEQEVYLEDVGVDEVRVELHADPIDDHPRVRQEMARERSVDASNGYSVFRACVPADRPASDYTPRIVPSGTSGLAVPLEQSRILWQR
jgi:starch phosphorylase